MACYGNCHQGRSACDAGCAEIHDRFERRVMVPAMLFCGAAVLIAIAMGWI